MCHYVFREAEVNTKPETKFHSGLMMMLTMKSVTVSGY